MFPGKGFSLAHLVPKDRTCSCFFGPALSLICEPVIEEKEDEEKKEMAEDEKMIDRLGRTWFTSDGLRHLIEGYHGLGEETILGIKTRHPYNYLCLPEHHAPFLDHMRKGKLVICPIWTDELKTWKECMPFSVMVVADEPAVFQWLGLTSTDKPVWIGECSNDEVERGTKINAGIDDESPCGAARQ